MTEEEYQKLIELTLNMRCLESMLAEAIEILKQVNEVLKELVLKESQ